MGDRNIYDGFGNLLCGEVSMPSVLDITYETPPHPRQVRLDTTTRCNAQCLSCHRFLSKRQGEMPSELIDQILNDVSRWKQPLTEIIPVNYGELMCRKDWFEILQRISSKLPNTRIVLPTNGGLWTGDSVGKICSIPTLKIINFSVNAYFDETYRLFTHLHPSTMWNIRKAMERVRAQRPDITLWSSMVFSPIYHTDLERDLFIQYWRDIATPQVLTASSAGRDMKPITPVKIPCRSIFSDFVVGFDGKLSSCCFDSSFSIDLDEYSGTLAADWNSNIMNEFRRLHLEHRRDEIPICKSCTFA